MAKPGTEIMLYHRVGDGGELSGWDARLLQMAAERKTMEQMYEELGRPSGVSPARLGQRVREILNSQDWLSITDQKALLLLDFVKLRDVLWERLNGIEEKFNKHGDLIEVSAGSGWAQAFIRLLREWRGLLESMSADIDSDRLMIREAHAKIMIDALWVMFERFVLRLEAYFAEYKRLPTRVEMNDMLEDVMPYAFESLEEKTAS